MSARTRRLLLCACLDLLALLGAALLGACTALPYPADGTRTAEPPLAAGTPTPPAAKASPAIALPASSLQTPPSAPPTTVVEYAPQRPDGEPRAASCWTNSLAVPSRAAWRCNVDNQVLDPCFVLANDELVCNPNPLTGYAGVPVELKEPLPQPDLIVEKASSPWLIQLDDSSICSLSAGATGMVGDKRITYLCGTASANKEDPRTVILGELRPGTVWQAEKATLALREGKFVATASQTVPLRAVVRGPLAFVPYACAPLAEGMANLLGVEAERAEVPFVDPIGGERGTACQAMVAGPFWDGLARPAQEVVAQMLATKGWQEEPRYRAISAVPATVMGFRKANALCLLSINPPGREGPAQAMPATAGGSQTDNQPRALALACISDRSVSAEPPPAEPQRILFEPDATAGSLHRPIAAGEVQEYIVRAFAGQTVILNVSSPRGDVFLSLARLDDGLPIVLPSANARRWQGQLPTASVAGLRDYVVRLAARGEATEFTLDLTIPATLAVPPGGKSVAVKGTLKAGQSVHYLLPSLSGRRATLTVASPQQDVFLTASGLEDGQALVPRTARATAWTGALPQAQGYVVELFSDRATPTDYTLEVQVQ